MLYPQSNEKRSVLNLNGVWNYKFVSDDFVPSEKSIDVSPMAVPASMNDILTDRDKANYIGKVLYEREFSLPADEQASDRLGQPQKRSLPERSKNRRRFQRVPSRRSAA